MNGKHRWIALGVLAVCVAIGATVVLWPTAEPVAATWKTPDQQQRPSAGFDSATLLTAARPQSATPLDGATPAPQAEPSTLGLAHEGPPISFMPERLELADGGSWHNGWDEPVAGREEGILAHLPDWSAAAEWLVPSKPIAEVTDPQPIPHSDLSVEPPLQEPPLPEPSPPEHVAASATHPRYVVEPSDTLWTISQRTYGTGAFFVALAKHNRSVIVDPHTLEVGQSLVTPPAKWLLENFPQLCPPPSKAIAGSTVVSPAGSTQPEYVVRQGDTLDAISVISLGRSDRWREILALNQDILGTSGGYLKPGMVLELPPDARAATTVLRPADPPR